MLILQLGNMKITVQNIGLIPAREWKGHSLRRIVFLWHRSLRHIRLLELFLHYDKHEAQRQKQNQLVNNNEEFQEAFVRHN